MKVTVRATHSTQIPTDLIYHPRCCAFNKSIHVYLISSALCNSRTDHTVNNKYILHTCCLNHLPQLRWLTFPAGYTFTYKLNLHIPNISQKILSLINLLFQHWKDSFASFELFKQNKSYLNIVLTDYGTTSIFINYSTLSLLCS